MNFKPKHIRVKPRQIFVCIEDMLLFLFILSVLLLTACEGKGGRALSSNQDHHTIRTDAPASMSIDPLLPPGASDRPVLPGESGRERTAEGLPILDPKGPNLKQIFRQDIKDPIDRIKRVENAVLEMRQDLDSVLPAINRLVSVETDIQELTTQLKALLVEENGIITKNNPGEIDHPLPYSVIEDEKLSGPVQQDVGPVNVNADQDQSKLIVSSGNVMGGQLSQVEKDQSESRPEDIQAVLASLGQGVIEMSAIRIGNHPDKVRIVINAPVDIKYTTDLDPQEHILVVDLPNVGVRQMNQDVASNPLIKSISLNASKNSERGGQVVFELKKNAQIKRSMIMPPSADLDQFRILIDLEK